MTKKNAPCASVPPFERLNYFYGQVLGHHELRTEQAYFHEKQKLHNRCLHGWGVVCGLLLEPAPQPRPDECPPGTTERPLARLTCGLALDCHGNEIVVRHDVPLDLWEKLDPDDRKRVEAGHDEVHVYLCYRERLIDPARPALPDACDSTTDSQFGKIEDCWELRVSTHLVSDDRCETCCEPCRAPCLLLTTICGFRKDKPIEPHLIRNGVRRMLSLYQHTTISGINWVHGATYHYRDIHHLLHQGLKVHFSRPVLTETVFDGVADLWVIRDERFSEIWNLETEIETEPGEYTHWMALKQSLKERLQDGDRLLFTLRAGFILDRCCRPVDGLHVGGRVPYLGAGEPRPVRAPDNHHCHRPPHRPGPWTSGYGGGGATFESWLWIREDDSEEEREHGENEEKRRGVPTGGGQ
jgi:hypothetical protein